MGVSLEKGANVSLTKEAGGTLTEITVGLGWDPRTTDGVDFDLDASAFILGETGKVSAQSDFVYFNNLKNGDGTVTHQGDNLTGQGDGDDEQIVCHLGNMAPNVSRIVFAVTIYKAKERNQKFGDVRNAFIRVVDNATGKELARYDLSEDYATQTAVNFGEVYRHNGEWKMRALGEGYASGLEGLVNDYGVNAVG